MGRKLRKLCLNRLFLDGLGDAVSTFNHEDANPLLVDLNPPYALRLRVYLFNCTNPPGGRALDEYKVQVILPGQKRAERASLDYSDNRMPLLVAYVCLSDNSDEGVFVLWDSYIHADFSYSANMQVKADAIFKATYEPIAESRRNNEETVVVARPQYLLKAIKRRIEIMSERVREEYDEQPQ
jgi:hypothetical protein